MEVIQQMLWKERIALAPRWPWNLSAILVRKEFCIEYFPTYYTGTHFLNLKTLPSQLNGANQEITSLPKDYDDSHK